MNPIPDKVTNYNVYDEGQKIVGIASELTLPNLEAMSESISGAGILGEIESAIVGHFGSITCELTFRTLNQKSFTLNEPEGRTLTLRASQQINDQGNGGIKHQPVKIVLKTVPKGIDLGKLGVGVMTETKNTFEITYIKVDIDNKEVLLLDKLNFEFRLNGKDYLADVRNNI